MNVQSREHGVWLIRWEIKDEREKMRPLLGPVEDVSVSVLCSACYLNVDMFMFRSHQWALPGWHTTLWRYLPSVFSFLYQLLSFKDTMCRIYWHLVGFEMRTPHHPSLREHCGSLQEVVSRHWLLPLIQNQIKRNHFVNHCMEITLIADIYSNTVRNEEIIAQRETCSNTFDHIKYTSAL